MKKQIPTPFLTGILTTLSNPSYTSLQMEEIKVDPIVKPIQTAKTLDRKTVLLLLVPVVLGLLTGGLLYYRNTQGTSLIAGRNVEVVSTPTEVGVKDASTFKDTAIGTLTVNDGKVTTEGTNILVRGDTSQNVYLTSSVIDLSKYVGKKVQIWGETYQGQKAGWLMDVGRLKVLQ